VLDLPGLRKTPTQARGWKRVQGILDAAAELFADQGFETTSMAAIADKAGTSIGSVYQFFEKKQDVFIALAHQCLEQVKTFAALLTGEAALQMQWPELIDASVDGFVALSRASPGLRALNANIQQYGLFEAADAAQSRVLIDQAAKLLPLRIPGLAERDAHKIATLIITSINAAFFFGTRASPEEADELIEETKRMLRAYVSTYV
jgi:AcrR family transcriptional regulator